MSASLSAGLGRFQHVRRMALFGAIVVACAALLFCSSRYGDGLLHEFLEAFGIGLIGLGIVGRLWCTVYIGGRKSAEIVDRGPYSVTRNPLYVFSAIAATGVGAQTGSIVVALFFGVATAAAFHVVILREERHLGGLFGDVYAAYRARVPRFFPRFALFRDADRVEVRPERLYRTLGDGLVFLLAVPAFEAIELLQQAGWLPILLRLP
jgi:protein-S-isoprenylcysteine O-methyltransferase Ste14